MAVVVEVVSSAFESVGDAVGAVAEVIGDAAQEVGNSVIEVGEAVVKTVEAIAEDPVKALPLIAVAVAAPYVAPYLWAGASTASAAMVLNTGIALANGADPINIAQNLATSYVTQGLTANLPVDISTGYSIVDQAINNAANAAIQGRDIESAIGSGIGGSLISMGTRAISKGIDDIDFSSDSDETAPSQSYSDLSREMTAEYPTSDVSEDSVFASQIFKDAIDNGFSPEEAYAIAQGQSDAENPQQAYAPTASIITSDQPQATVKVEAAPSEFDNAEPIKQEYEEYEEDETKTETKTGGLNKLPTDATGDFYQLLADETGGLDYVPTGETGSLDQVPTGETGGLDQIPTDETGDLDQIPTDETTPTAPTVPYDALNETINEDGSKVYTYDDGSTLTLDGNGEVLDVTDAIDTGFDGAGLDGLGGDDLGGDDLGGDGFEELGPEEYEEEEYIEEEDPESKSGFSLKSGKPRGMRLSFAKAARSKIVPKTKTPAAKAPETGLDALSGGQYGVGLTSNVSRGNTEYDLLGEVGTDEPQNFSTGGSTATQGIYDLSTTASSPFLGGGNADIKALKPGMIKGRINYALPGYPFGQEWKAAKAGGPIQDAPKGHNPEFFSEGGLGSMKNTYVKGAGDGTSDSIAAMLANGEFVIPADVVSSLGNGSNDSGAKVLDEFLRTIRAHKRKANPKGLPPDSKGALGYLAAAKKKVKK
jgi:hypothetical protein